MDYEESVLFYLGRGCCCAEALVCLALEILEEEDELFANAAAGLCNGMHSGGVCGALTGGCLLLAAVDKSSAPELCRELCEWFDVTYAAQYGSARCADILGDNPWNKLERCKPLIAAVGQKCAELLQDHDLID